MDFSLQNLLRNRFNVKRFTLIVFIPVLVSGGNIPSSFPTTIPLGYISLRPLVNTNAPSSKFIELSIPLITKSLLSSSKTLYKYVSLYFFNTSFTFSKS